MANTRSGGSQKDGGESGSSRRSAAVKEKDSKSSTTPGSSANGSSRSKAAKSSANARETRSLSAHVATDGATLRRSNRETPTKKSKIPIPSSRKPSTPSSQKSTRLGNVTPVSSDKKKLKRVVESARQSPTRKSKRIKNNASTSSASKDSNRTSSSVATPKKSEKKQVAIESQKKNKQDRSQHASGSSKKRKRLDARSYRALFKPLLEEAKSPVVVAPVRMDEENAYEGHVVDSNIGVVYEEKCDALEEEDNQTHSDEAVNEVSEGSTSGLHEASEGILEKDGLVTEFDPRASFSEVQPHKFTDMCSQNNIVERSVVLEAREQPAGLANRSCLPASPSQMCSPVHNVKAKKALEDSDSMGIQEEHSTSGDFEVPLTDETNSDDNLCVVCKTPGILKCCDGKGCKRRYHLSCLDPPLQSVSPGIWLCTFCIKKRIQFGIYSVTEGVESLWDVKEGMQNGKQYFVKYKSLAHVYNRWIPKSEVINDIPGGPDLVSKFNKRRNHKEKTMGWKQEWAEPHRLLKKRSLMPQKEADEFFNALGDKFAYCNVEWLVKWRDLGYEHATWELETSPFLCTPEAGELKKNYESRHEAARKASDPAKTNKVKQTPFHKLQRLPDGCPPGLDNDHLSSINQLREFWHKSHGAVFVDDQERVIKTILFTMSVLPDVCRPFLIVSTSASLSLWETKFNRLAPSINVVVYNGEKDVRRSIQDLEFYEKGGCVMLQVLLSHPDAILEDIETIECIGWEAVIVDECQNSRVSKCLEQLKRLSTDFRMVLLSSPVKDNLPEYINLLSFLDSGEKDMSPSVSNVDSADTVGTLAMLKAKFTRYVAYERKADSSKFLEYWVPARLSHVQLELYCATLLSNLSALRSCSKIDHVGALRNVLITLRKCCDHPYLVDQLLQSSLTKDHPLTEILDIGVHASGKLLLLDKMLKEIWNKGLRVVILFQSGGGVGNPMGDILDDFVRQRYGPESYERVERGLLMSRKQKAMNMFNDKTKGRFIFLIEHRACLPSIKLSSVDAIIIYGSDWNPLNDLRALQKVSIESQSERVSIFRLYSTCTVEEKALMLAKQDIILDNIQSIIPSVSHSMLSWGASFLFSRLDGIQQDNHSSKGSDADKQFLDTVVLEFLTKLSTKAEATTERNSSAISKAHLSGTSYSRNIIVVGEREGISALDGDPPTFWLSLLDRRCPRWQYVSEQSQRSRRKVQNMEEPVKIPAEENDEARRKCRKVGENMVSVSPQALPDKSKDAVLPENSIPSSSSQQSLDETWQELGEEKLRNTQKSLHVQLKPELLNLCSVLGLPYNVRYLAEQFLEYIMNNHQVSQEPKGILQAFNISLCWRAASLLKHKLDHRESLALAAKYLNYECNELLAGFVYDKLRILKKKFSRKVDQTSNQGQPTSVGNNKSHYRKETSINLCNDGTISNQATFVHSKLTNGALQEGPSGKICTEQLVSEGQELISVPETCREQHLSMLNKIIEKKIDLVDMVFSLREKNILDKQHQEISKLEKDREKEVIKLKKVRDLVLEHTNRSHIDPEVRNAKIWLVIKWFSMLLYAFGEHMRCQCKKLEALQSATWTKEQQMKNKFLQEAKSGQLDEYFDRSIPLPDSDFVMEEFSYFREQDGTCNIHETPYAGCQHSSDDSSMIEITLVRNVIPSEAISTEAVSNGPAEVVVHSEGGPASEVVNLQENRSPTSLDDIGLEREVPLIAHHLSSFGPANDDSINQEPSANEHRTTEYAEGENIAGSIPSLGVAASQHLGGDVAVEVNANNNDIITADPLPHLELPISTAHPCQATLPVSREVQAQTNLISLFSQRIVAPSRQPPAEAEPAGMLGGAATQPSQSEMQPSTSISNVQPVRTRPDDRSQIGHQSETAHGPGQVTQLFPVASMMFNHPLLDDEPLKNELHRLRINGDFLSRDHEQKKLQLQMECNQEIEKIQRKYDLLLQDEDSTYLWKKKTLDDLYDKVLVNQSLAEEFRAKFIATSVSQGRGPSPPMRQLPQASQQVPLRSPPVVATASPIASAPAARPPMPTSLPSSRPRVQPSHVARPSSSLQGFRPSSSILPGNLVRATPSPFSQMPPPRGSYAVRNEQARAPAPHLQRSRVPSLFSAAANLTQNSVVSTNQQQLPARPGFTSRTQVAPVTPVNLTPSSSHTVLPATLPLSSSQTVPPATLPPSSSHIVPPAILPPPSSHAVLPATLAPSSLNMAPVSRGTSVSPDVPLESRHVGACITNMQQSESESASLDTWLVSNLGLRDDPPVMTAQRDANGDVVCISDDEWQ